MKTKILFVLFVVFCFNLSGQGSFKDPRDGNIYKTIVVGNTIWMAENLRYDDAVGSSYFDGNTDNKEIYGNLYDWKTATKVCPKNWHLPSGAEFNELINYYDKTIGLEKIVKDTNTVNFQLGGMRDFEGTDSEIDESGYYWTSTEYDNNYAQYFSYLIILNDPVIDLSRKEDIEDVHGSEKVSRYSVRCVRQNGK
jgi:uncharacterized protein (TIGR02145 family)